jgi:hypothetical protein
MYPAITPEQDIPEDLAPSRRRIVYGIIWNPLFWICLAMSGSAFVSLRFEVAGMAFHPYMVLLFPLLFRAIPRIHRFPARIGRPAGLFLFLYVISLIQGTGFVIQLTKISVMAITFVIIAVSVRSPSDFVAGAFGLAACAGLLCIRGYMRGVGNFGNINPIEGSQKNAFSLFYLPGLALCLYLVFSDDLSIRARSFLALMITLMFSAIALLKNRSGWLASGVLLLLVFGTNRNRLRIAMFVVLLASIAFVVADVVTREAQVAYERDATLEAQSDNLRLQLIIRAISIGFQHPLLGVSPTRLTRMLGTIEKVGDEGIDCHNLTGYLIGGSGLFTFAAFCLFAFAMLRPPKSHSHVVTDSISSQGPRMLTTMTIIWLVRAQFQEDVLFSVTFAAGLALCVGLCNCTGVYDRSSSSMNHA